ncbi:MAG TPA: GAF domain-containing protein [Vicinamibacterales bacterium]|nr:GAF domain-containing protein [Vicinamibacterales bacterium]
MSVRLHDIWRCFQGVVPAIIATADRHGTPNVTYLSQVHLVDERHVALSRQFFNKTSRNLDENPVASVEVIDPVTLQAYRLRLKFLRSEKSGALFDTMKLRIDAIASHTGMAGIFRLIAADVFEVVSADFVDGFLAEPPRDEPAGASLDGKRTEIRGLQWVSERINRATDLESLLSSVLAALDEYFGFAHSVVLLHDETRQLLTAIASRGYGPSGIGAEVPLGDGLIGTVAREQRLLRLTSLEADLRYGRAVRRESAGGPALLQAEIPLPGLRDAQSVLAIPLTVGSRLVGVIAAEDRDPMRFSEWDEAYLAVIANQIALGLDRMIERCDENADPPPPTTVAVAAPPPPPLAAKRAARRVTYYTSDDAIFVDDEYLIRNIPARILWKVLGESQRTGRTEFSNREMRLDPSLGLPAVKDNLESRLILLRHRLQEKCPDLQIVPTGRGRFALRAEAPLELVER